MAKYRLVAFDLDDTLAMSKAKIEPRMAGLLSELLGRVPVCIISGGRFEQFDLQVLQHLKMEQSRRENLHLMPTCGTRYYRWVERNWEQVYAEDFDDAEKAQIVEALTRGAKNLGLWEPDPWGEIIEDRGSQITLSALGQKAPAKAKYAWDPDGTKKDRLRDYVARELPGLEVRGGGLTSIDVTKKGVDKAYGMRKMLEFLTLSQEQVLFIGDRLDPGGNDYPVKKMGIQCIAVHGWSDTANHVEALLKDSSTQLG
jgi:HAD superfamily hydrolase (TIGR01484 family)